MLRRLGLVLTCFLLHACGSSSNQPPLNDAATATDTSISVTDAIVTSDTTAAADVAPPPDAASQTDAIVSPDSAGPNELARVQMTDVSILYPLPTGMDLSGLIAVTETGVGGPLLPAAALARIPSLDRAAPNDITKLRVLAVRFDPCFPGRDATGPIPCRAQVRLVAQPMRPLSAGQLPGAADGAIHLHYEITNAELRALVARVLALRIAAGVADGAPFGLHPALTPALDTPFATGLKALLLANIGAGKLRRITFTTRTAARQPLWEFGGVNIDAAGAVTDLAHVGVTRPPDGSPPVQLLNDQLGMRYVVTPDSSWEGALTPLYVRTEIAAITTPVRTELTNKIHRLEHPSETSPESVDCVSCHIAMHLRHDATSAWTTFDSTGQFTSPLPLTLPFPTIAGQRDRVRAFGYFEREPQVNQRVVNETAAAVDRFRNNT